MLCRADESGDGEAVERARAGVQVRQQHAEGVTVELDHVELQKWSDLTDLRRHFCESTTEILVN